MGSPTFDDEGTVRATSALGRTDNEQHVVETIARRFLRAVVASSDVSIGADSTDCFVVKSSEGSAASCGRVDKVDIACLMSLRSGMTCEEVKAGDGILLAPGAVIRGTEEWSHSERARPRKEKLLDSYAERAEVSCSTPLGRTEDVPGPTAPSSARPMMPRVRTAETGRDLERLAHRRQTRISTPLFGQIPQVSIFDSKPVVPIFGQAS